MSFCYSTEMFKSRTTLRLYLESHVFFVQYDYQCRSLTIEDPNGKAVCDKSKILKTNLNDY